MECPKFDAVLDFKLPTKPLFPNGSSYLDIDTWIAQNSCMADWYADLMQSAYAQEIKALIDHLSSIYSLSLVEETEVTLLEIDDVFCAVLSDFRNEHLLFISSPVRHLERFPDARIIMTHRDLRKVVASYVALQLLPITALIRNVGEGGAKEATAIRSVALALTKYCQELAVRALRFEEESSGRALHVRHADLMANPMAIVRKVYKHFKIKFTEKHRQAIAKDLAANPPRASGAGKYSLEELGLTEDDVVSENVKKYHSTFLGLAE